MLILDAWVEVWPVRDVQAGRTEDRAVLHVDLGLSGKRRAALTRLLRAEHVLTAVNQAASPLANDADWTEHTAGITGSKW
ncbi:MAG TPA: hypothetical protein VGS80_27235 [Ktedonobacterales bacterium]|nr:hypothetical protein [Ktedonobacterales bacterium]